MVRIELTDDEAIMLKSALDGYFVRGEPGIRPRLFAARSAFESVFLKLSSVQPSGTESWEARRRLDARWLADHPEERSDWTAVHGAEVLRKRLGWWPTLHDAELLWAKWENRDGQHRLELRLELNEGGPCDRFTLAWDNVSVFDVDGWDHQSTAIYFSGSTLRQVADEWQLSLTGGQSNWTVRGGPVSILNHEEEPGQSWIEGHDAPA